MPDAVAFDRTGRNRTIGLMAEMGGKAAICFTPFG